MTKPTESGSKLVSTIFIGKWTVKVLSALNERPHRHSALLRRLKGVSQRMLTRTLRNLESTGLIARRVENSKPIAVEYSLTKLGRAFIGPLLSFCGFATDHHWELSAVVRLRETDPKE